MKIIHAAVRREAIPLKTPFVTALRRVDRIEFIVLELTADNGLSALGSAPATRAVTGETLESIEETLNNHIIPRLHDRPFNLVKMCTEIAGAVPGNGSAKAAADMALYSLAACEKGRPLYAFLGHPQIHPVKTAVTVSLGDVGTMERQAVALFDAGYDILKIKVGSPDGKDVQRIRRIAEALPSAALIVDANQAWSVQETFHVLSQIHDLPLALLEQPVSADDLEGLKAITGFSPFPVLADEAVFSVDDARRVIETHAADMINIKLMKCGGISGALEIIALCERHGVKCMLGSMLEGPVSIEAALHLAMAFPACFTWIDLDSPLLYRDFPADFTFSTHANVFTLLDPSAGSVV